MAKSDIRLYKDCIITPEKLFRVDDLEKYLNTLTSILKQDCNFIKHQVKLNIVLNMSQYGLAFNMDNINYMKITNDSDSLGVAFPVYYFIVNKKWTSMEAVTFELVMDTLNTFTEANGSFVWDNKTKITRQHKDRYYRNGNKIFPIIDKTSEDINPILFKVDNTPVIDSFDTDWYLIYINSTNEENSPVNCLVTPGERIITQRQTPAVVGTIYPNMLFENQYYYRKGTYNITFTLSNGVSYTITQAFDKAVFYRLNNKIVFTWIRSNVQQQHVVDWFSINNDLSCKYSDVLKLNYDDLNYEGVTPVTFYADDYPDVFLSSIKDLDRTDSKLIKVIKLPYSPSLFNISNGRLNVIPEDYIFVQIQNGNQIFFALQLKNLDIKFKNSITFYSPPLRTLNGIENTDSLDFIANKDNGSHDDIEETKMFHSEFYNEAFVYDTFRFTYQLEYAYSFNDQTESMTIDFIVTSTMNSKFMFKFNDYYTPGYDTSDYNNVLVIARNNELPLYNSAYLNYIRNGFNYDVKTKERNETATWLGVGLTLAGAVGLAVFGGSFGIAGAIGLGTSAVAQIANAINTTQQADQNMKQKLEQYRNQAVSVSGSDDVDLMSEYCDNRLQKMVYSPSSQMYDLLQKLFYYSGYKENAFGVPNLNTRYWFNFIMCDLVMKSTSNISEEIKQDLIERYALGVTIFHNRGTQTSPAWNFEQTKENIEMSLEYNVPLKTYRKVTSISQLHHGDKVLFGTKDLLAENGGAVADITHKSFINCDIINGVITDDGTLDDVQIGVDVISNSTITFRKPDDIRGLNLKMVSAGIFERPEYVSRASGKTTFNFQSSSLKIDNVNSWLGYLTAGTSQTFVKVTGSGGNPPSNAVCLYVLED